MTSYELLELYAERYQPKFGSSTELLTTFCDSHTCINCDIIKLCSNHSFSKPRVTHFEMNDYIIKNAERFI